MATARALLGVIAMVLAPSGNSPQYLSDLPERIVHVTQSWGQLGLDTCAHLPGTTPLPLQIGEKTYAKGLGSHANGEIVVELDGRYAWFEAEVGVQRQQGATGTVRFQVFADRKRLFDSGVMGEADPPRPVRVSVEGRQELRLVALDGGDGITCDCANWADARLTPSTRPKAASADRALDIAPFAAARSWDWRRREGTKATRLQPMPEEDLRPYQELARDRTGYYSVPAVEGRACIGLEWLERRALARVELDFGRPAPDPAGAVLERWVHGREGASPGGSTWQGHWEAVPAAIRVSGTRWLAEMEPAKALGAGVGTLKIRWVLPAADGHVKVRALHAFTRSRWRNVGLLLRRIGREPAGGRIGIYNGELVPARRGTLSWDGKSDLRMTVLSCASTYRRADRTVLRVRIGSMAFGIAVEDIQRHGAVWVQDAGLFVTLAEKPLTLEDYLRRYPGQTVLAAVRSRADQTLTAAMKLHHAAQDRGPTLLSLPADNRKFIVERMGVVRWDDRPEVYASADRAPGQAYRRMAQVDLGISSDAMRRSLALDPPRIRWSGTSGGLTVESQAFVGALGGGAAFVQRVDLRNPYEAAVRSTLNVRFEGASLQRSGSRVTAAVDGRVVGVVHLPEGEICRASLEGDKTRLEVFLPGKARASLLVLIAHGASLDPDDVTDALYQRMLNDLRAIWRKQFNGTAEVNVPDPLLHRLIAASRVHCLLAARTDAEGRVAAWIGSIHYGPLESEAQSVIRGMQYLGHLGFAKSAHEFFLARYSPEGFLTTGYTIMGTGWHLWCLGEYAALTRDDAWLRAHAGQVERACRWIMSERRKSPSKTQEPASGLMPPGALADWEAFAYYFYANANYCAGLREAAKALRAIDTEGAAAIEREAAAYVRDILRAFRWAQSMAPVVPLRDGRWVPFYPTQLYSHGLIEELYPGEDVGRSWCYDVELGSQHLIPLGILSPDSKEARWMHEHLEDVMYLRDGWFAYPEAENRKDWWTRGGFAKVQPYYARTVEGYAEADDVRPFVRSFMNTIPTLLNREDLSFWEHFNASAAWNKTHETGYFLYQARTMLLQERGSELWIVPFIPQQWLGDGKVIEVRHAPTRFGPMGFRIVSRVAAGRVEAQIEMPDRQAPSAVVLRLRHPEGRPLRAVEVNGRTITTFSPADSTIRLRGRAGKLNIVARY